MTPSSIQQHLVSWVRQAAPYIHAFRGKIFVIGLSGETILSPHLQSIIHDIALLDAMGVKLVLVHGSRPQIDAEIIEKGLTPEFHKGLRVTDKNALECVKSATGKMRIEIEALLSQGLPNTPLAGGFLRMTGGNFFSAKPVGVVDGIDHQYTGNVRKVIADEILADLSQENVVLISPIAASPSGEIFNLSSEEVTEAVATAISADKLVWLCKGQGLVNQDNKLIKSITVNDVETLLQPDQLANHNQSEEVIRILPSSIKACKRGIDRIHILNRESDGAMLMEFFTHEGIGTVISKTSLAQIRQATSHDVDAIQHLIAPLETEGFLRKRERTTIDETITDFLVLSHDDVVVGCAALHINEDQKTGELACLTVANNFQKLGYGQLLCKHIEEKARRLELTYIYTLTTRTLHWFREQGFIETSSEKLPQARQDSYSKEKRQSKILLKEL